MILMIMRTNNDDNGDNIDNNREDKIIDNDDEKDITD